MSRPGTQIALLAVELELIAWYLQRNQVFQAIALARERLVPWIMVQAGMAAQTMERDARLKTEKAIGQQLQQLQAKATEDSEGDLLPDLSGIPNVNDVAQLFAGGRSAQRSDACRQAQRRACRRNCGEYS